MFRFLLLIATITLASASGYGHGFAGGFGFKSAGFGHGYGHGLGHGYGGFGLGGFGYGHGLAFAHGYGPRAVYAGPINAAIQSTRTYEVVPVPLHYEAPVPQTIEVGPNIQPVNMIFRTQSSPLNLQQVHTPAAPQYESTRSEDAPSVLRHENYKPVIQEYKEVIQPYRRIEQHVQPVIENVHTVVAKGDDYRPAPLVHAPAPLAYHEPAPLAIKAPLPLLAGRADY